MLSRRLPRPLLLAATALVLAAVAVVVTRGDGGADVGPSPEAVRAVELQALGDGEPGRLGDLLDGQPVLLNFFAETCAPCREEMPDFQQIHQDLGDQLHVVGVSLDRKPEKALEIIAETGVTYPTYADPSGEVLAVFEGTQLPTTVFIDADGTVREIQMERLRADELRTKIADNFDVSAE